MPLEDILRKIEETSSEESKKILAEAEEKARAIMEKARQEASAQKGRTLEEARLRAGRLESLSLARSDSKRRQTVLKEKEILIDSVFSTALQRLRDLPSQEYRRILLGAISDWAQGDETIVAGPEDEEKLGRDFASVANRVLSESGKTGRLSVTYAPRSLGGGCVLQRGGVSQNLTFPALLTRLRDGLEMEVARMLFREE